MTEIEFPEEGAIPLGGNHWYVPVYEFDTDKFAGINEWHLNSRGEWCAGWVPFEGRTHRTNGAEWQVLSVEPLTLSPSLLCSCGNHGWIREGKWVEA